MNLQQYRLMWLQSVTLRSREECEKTLGEFGGDVYMVRGSALPH
jgi:hypothetical protein